MRNTCHLRIGQLALLLMVGLSSAAWAERTAQMLYFRAPKDAPERTFIYQEGKEPLEVELPRNNFTSSFNLASGDLVMRFLPSVLPEGSEFPKKAPAVKVPAGWGKVLILAFHNPKNQVMPVKFKVINASSDTLGAGDRMFVNFTDSKVFGYVGKKKLTLKGNSSATVKRAAAPNEEYQVKLDRIDPVSKKRRTFIRQVWRQSASRRSLIFVYSPPGSKVVTYYSAPVRDL